MWHWAGHLLWIAFGPSTWGAGGNMLAWVICGVLVFIFRGLLGKWLAAWWARHHGPHAIAQQREALRQHEEERDAGTGLRARPVPG